MQYEDIKMFCCYKDVLLLTYHLAGRYLTETKHLYIFILPTYCFGMLYTYHLNAHHIMYPTPILY